MTTPLFNYLVTTQDALQLIEQLEYLKQGLYQKTGSIDTVLLRLFSKEKGEGVRHVLLSLGGIQKETIASLQAAIRSMPRILLTVAREMPQESMERMSMWLREKCGHPVLLDLTYDASLVGGAVVQKDGKYRDFSLKKMLDREDERKATRHV